MVISKAGLRRYLPAETFQPLVWLGLFLAFSALPVALVYATRASPTFLALACLALFADEVRRNPRLARLRALSHGSWKKPMVVPLTLLALLGLASAAWSAAPSHSLLTALQFAGTLLLGVAWVALVSRFRREHVLPFLAGGLTVALIALPVELFSEHGIRSLFSEPTMRFEYNRTILQLSLLASLFAALAGFSGERLWRAWAALLVSGSIALALLSDSQSAPLYWLVFALAALAAGWWPRLSLAAVALSAGLLIVAFPWAFLLWPEAIANVLAAPAWGELADAANVEDRLLIWTELSRLVAERPWLGWGMEGERAIDVVARAIEGGRLSYSPHHPHSLALELWTGLGAAGVALALAVLAAFARLLARYGDRQAAWGTSLFAGIVAVWLVSHGAWEHWWLVMLPLSLGTLLVLDFYPGEGPAIAAS